MPQGVSGGTYLIALLSSGFVSTNLETRRDLAFQLCFQKIDVPAFGFSSLQLATSSH